VSGYDNRKKNNKKSRTCNDRHYICWRGEKIYGSEGFHAVPARPSVKKMGGNTVEQCFSTAEPRPGTGPWHQLYRAARGSPGICHFSFLSYFMNKCFIVEIF